MNGGGGDEQGCLVTEEVADEGRVHARLTGDGARKLLLLFGVHCVPPLCASIV